MFLILQMMTYFRLSGILVNICRYLLWCFQHWYKIGDLWCFVCPEVVMVMARAALNIRQGNQTVSQFSFMSTFCSSYSLNYSFRTELVFYFNSLVMIICFVVILDCVSSAKAWLICYYPMPGTEMHQIVFSLIIVALYFKIWWRKGLIVSLLNFLSSYSRWEVHRVLECLQTIYQRPKRIQGSRISWCWSVGSMDGRLQGSPSAAAPMLIAKERALELYSSNSSQQAAW